MNNSDKQFKKYIVIIISVVAIILYAMINPDLSNILKKDSVLQLSSQEPWSEEINDEKYIDDVEINLEDKENEFKKEEINNPFKFSKDKENDNDEFWVTGSVPINSMSDLNYKTRNDIFKQRTAFVEKTIFKNKNYIPSNAVFGQIAEKKPWLSIDALTCTGRGPKANIGLSEESRYINNPTMLIGLDRLSFDEKEKKDCSPVDYLMPTKINYSKDTNTIKVVFEVSSYKGELGRNFLLNGINARDLGFNYIFADEMGNSVFINKENVSNKIYKLKDFIHLGTACGVKGGCNNGAPLQRELHTAIMKYPASIHFKLWKKMPKNKDFKPDINYLIIFK